MYSALWYLVAVIVTTVITLGGLAGRASAPFLVGAGVLVGVVIGVAIARLMNATIVELEAGAYGRRKGKEAERRERQMRQQLERAIVRDKKAGLHERT